MRILSTLLLAGLVALSCIASMPEPAQAQKAKAEEKDMFCLYRIAGRKWVLKRTPKAGTEGYDPAISFHAFEVLNVWEDRAEITQTTLDPSRQDTSGDVFKIKVPFDEKGPQFQDPIGFKKGKIEKVKTDAGTFECVVWAGLGREDGDAYIWRSIEFPGLIVKQDDRFGTRVLDEFTWIDGESGFKGKAAKKKPAKKKEADDSADNQRLFKRKGASWTLRTVTEHGERRVRNFDVRRHEVVKVSDTESELHVTKVTQLLEKIKGEEPETVIVKFDETFEDRLRPTPYAKHERTEKRITEIGLLECEVYTFKDDEGREGRAWYAKDWPGLLVRTLVEGEEYKLLTEILKFEE